MNQSKSIKERCIETHLRYYHTYLVSIKNCEQQLEYIMPSLVTTCGINEQGSFFYIVNDTEKVAIDRVESKKAIDLREEIERNKLITNSIDNALDNLKVQEREFVTYRYFECLPIHEITMKMGYSDEKSLYRIRRHILDKLLISLNNLLVLK